MVWNIKRCGLVDATFGATLVFPEMMPTGNHLRMRPPIERRFHTDRTANKADMLVIERRSPKANRQPPINRAGFHGLYNVGPCAGGQRRNLTGSNLIGQPIEEAEKENSSTILSRFDSDS